MTANEGKINVLCKNYEDDDMTDEGKTELLMIGEKYLRELTLTKEELRLTDKTRKLEFKGCE